MLVTKSALRPLPKPSQTVPIISSLGVRSGKPLIQDRPRRRFWPACPRTTLRTLCDPIQFGHLRFGVELSDTVFVKHCYLGEHALGQFWSGQFWLGQFWSGSAIQPVSTNSRFFYWHNLDDMGQHINHRCSRPSKSVTLSLLAFPCVDGSRCPAYAAIA